DPHQQRTVQQRKQNIPKAAQTACPQADRRLVNRAIDLLQAYHRGLIADGNIPEDHRNGDERATIQPIEPALVEGSSVAYPEEDPRNGGRPERLEIDDTEGCPLTALQQLTVQHAKGPSAILLRTDCVTG